MSSTRLDRNTSSAPAPIEVQELKSRAAGRWPEILSGLAGIEASSLNGRHHPCPKCGGSDRFRLIDASTGAVLCNQCFRTGNGDGIAAMQWMMGCSFPEAMRRLAQYVGLSSNGQVHDVVADIARRKRVPVDQLKAFGAHKARREQLTVCRIPMYGPDGLECSHFDLSSRDQKWLKGVAAKGKPTGVFLRDGAVPQAGHTVALVEGVKDAAALCGLGIDAVGLPSCVAPQKFVQLFAGVHVIIVPDRDTAGESGARTSAARLAGVAASVQIATLPAEMKSRNGADVRDVLAQPDGELLLRQSIEHAREWRPDDAEPSDSVEIREADDDPHRLARLCLSELPATSFYRSEFFQFRSPAYQLVAKDELRASVTAMIKKEFDRLAHVLAETEPGDEPQIRRRVSMAIICEVLDKIASLSLVPSETVLPAWIAEEAPQWAAGDCLVTPTGILPVSSLNATPTLLEPTPDLFAVNALEFGFDPQAECPGWLQFLRQLWPADPDSIQTLQEIAGYLLLPETRFQKAFLLIGPARSGKGTIARIFKHLVGTRNVCAPRLASLAGEFGLQPLLNKTLAIVGDMRLSRRQDLEAIVELILSITGEDPQTVNRKHLPSVDVDRLAVRFLLLSNELPILPDASATLPSRFIVLRLTESFLGREDTGLTDRLLGELPGILNWSLRGWQRIENRGFFVQPQSATELLDELEGLASPMRTFVRDECTTGPGAQVQVKELYQKWRTWCEQKGRTAGNEQTFGRNLRAAVPSIRITHPRDPQTGRQERAYEGIRLRLDAQ